MRKSKVSRRERREGRVSEAIRDKMRKREEGEKKSTEKW